MGRSLIHVTVVQQFIVNLLGPCTWNCLIIIIHWENDCATMQS